MDPGRLTVRELFTELTAVEDALRECRAQGLEGVIGINRGLLLRLQDLLVTELRRRGGDHPAWGQTPAR